MGYWLASEEHGPNEMVRAAQRAEARQGHSPFVWSVIGGVAATTKALIVGTGVTCPIVRIHPAIVAPGRGDGIGDARWALLPLAWATARISTST